MKVKLAETQEELMRLAPVLQELRPQYELPQLVERLQLQREQGYHLAYVEDSDAVLSVAGFVLGYKLAWGKHLYVDDLVTSATKRSTGAGRALLDWLKDYARSHDCEQLHLDSGAPRFGAHKFYFREGLHISGYHFVLELPATGA